MKNHSFRKCAIVAALFGSGVEVHAAEAVPLGKITVKGEAMKESDRSFTVNVISAEDIKSRRWENPLAIVREAPGVEVRSIQSGSVADFITIRGMTSGGHGGDVGLSLDGITLNEAEGHADGFADTNVIIPLEIGRLSLYKGPVSPLYGNFARGGVMAFTTRKGGEYLDTHLSAGSYGTYDGQAAFGGKTGPVQINGALQGYESQGWRDNSRFTKMNSAFRAAYQISDRSEIVLSLRGHGAWFEGPGNIGRDQFLDSSRRRQQAPSVAGQNDGGEKTYSSQRVDFNHLINNDLKLLTFVYNTSMGITRFESNTPNPPANQIERSHDRDVFAFGASLNGQNQLLGVRNNWVLGSERYDEGTHEDQWSTNTRVRGVKQRDRDFKITTTSLYGQADLGIHRLFRPTLGFRYDNFGGSLSDRLTGTKTNINDFSRISPKFGMRSELTDKWELRASAANGFALPSSVQKYDPNIKVDAVEFWQYEVGINGAPSPRWDIDVVAFLLNSSDEIQQVPGVVPPRLINAGKSQRIGLEGDVRYYPPIINHLELSTGFGLFDTEIKEGTDPAFTGKELQRVPRHIANFTVKYAPPAGWGGSLRWRSLGPYYTNNQNTGKYDGYDIATASVFYLVRGEKGRSVRWYMDINNMTNEVYAENVSGANAFGQPTSFNPRPPANVMFGVMTSLM